MNILVLSWRDPKHPLAGGAEQVMHEHMKGWIKAGHKVTFFSSFFKNAKREEDIDGIKIVRGGSELYLGVQIAAFIWYFFHNRDRFDLIVDEFHGYPFFTPFYSRAKKLAVIQEVAKEVWFLNHLRFPLNYIIGTIGYLTEPIIFLFYKNVNFLTGSKSAKEDVKKMGIKENYISIIPHGVLTEKVSPKITKEKVPTVIFLGALAKDKGVEDALKVFQLLSTRGRFNFWVVGRGSKEYLEELKELVKEYNLKRNIKFFGFVSQKEKFKLLKKAHVLINPSAREGWGLVNIEANFTATPVVAYKSQGLVDSVKKDLSGIFAPKSTPESMADAVFSLLSDKLKLKKLQEGSLKWADQFSWDSSSKKSLTLIEKIYNAKVS